VQFPSRVYCPRVLIRRHAGRPRCPPLLKTFAAKYRATLRGFERNCGFMFPEAEPALMLCPRFPLHALHRLGSFLKPLSAKNICSPAVNTNSAEQSAHFKILSLYSICHSRLGRRGSGAIHARRSLGFARDYCGSRLPAGMKLPGWTLLTWPNPAHAVASSGDVYARGLPLRDAFHRASYSNCAFLSL
jgi:hypothetical protein